jgi:dipeptide transport system substrate-binding protein
MKFNASFLKHLAFNIGATVISSSAIAAPKVFVYCSEASPSHLNPQLATDGASYNATSMMMFNRLVEFKNGETSIQPALAESWTVSKDGLKLTFKLRKDVKFQKTSFFTPTRNFNADDVLFSFNRQRLDSHPYHKLGGGSYEYFDSMDLSKIIKDIVKVDDHTVMFLLNQAEAPMLANLAMDFASIHSAEYGEQLLKAKTPEKMDTQPIGTGPFILTQYTKDNSIRYTANPDYFLGKVKLDKVVFAITPDASVRLQKLKTGECHLATEPSPADLDAIRKDPNLSLIEREGLNIGYLSFNVKKKPLDNEKVRQAVSYALNRKSYIDAIYLGNAVIAKNPIPPTIWSYSKKTVDYDYSIDKAKALLKEAGFPNGFEIELATLPVSRPYNPNGKKMGELMQSDLAKVGIKAKLVSYDWPTYLAKAKKGDTELLQMGWTGDNGDPDNFLFTLLSCAAVEGGSNYSKWCDPEFDKIVTEAKTTSDLKKRTALYEKSQAVFKKKAPWVTIAHSKTFRALRKNVTGFKVDPFGKDYFGNVDLK